MKLQTKLSFGLSFLFGVILVFGILGLFYVNRLSNDAAGVLQNNHESLVYCNNMLKALEEFPQNHEARFEFETNLSKQERNITERGEERITKGLRTDFDELLASPLDSSNFTQLRQGLQIITELNQSAILKKSEAARRTADNAKLWLSIIFCVLIIITLTFSFNFPAVIASPIKKLADGIGEISNKNYQKRIYINQHDEFGELAAAFNGMAEKLDEYEHSNLAQLRFEKSRIETVINQMKDGIIGLDDKKRILFLNAVAERLLNLKESAITGKYAADVAVNNDLMRTLLQDTPNAEFKIYADEKESFFNKDQLEVNSNGKLIGKVIVLKNITPFHELSEAKTNFIATISHELKTPISSIKMSASLLKDTRVGPLNDEQLQLLKGIKDDAERLLVITAELLDLSQAETGNIKLVIEQVDPHTIVDKAVASIEGNLREQKVGLVVQVPATLPLIMADGQKAGWVLINFLTNAIKYSPPNSTVTVEVSPAADFVRFTVTDQGPGIESQYLPRLFDRYFKVPGTGTAADTGLGLAISKQFIENQGGIISVKSEVGVGSIFSFSLKHAGALDI